VDVGVEAGVAERLDVADAADLMAAGRLVVSALGDEVLVIRSRLGVLAYTNRCPHAGRSLGDARVRRRSLECVGHGMRFDLATGRAIGCRASLRRWSAWIEQGRVWLSPPDVR